MHERNGKEKHTINSSIQYCPLMSAGKDIEVVCAQERCAWYMRSYKMCAAYILAHNAALDIQEKQSKKVD